MNPPFFSLQSCYKDFHTCKNHTLELARTNPLYWKNSFNLKGLEIKRISKNIMSTLCERKDKMKL